VLTCSLTRAQHVLTIVVEYMLTHATAAQRTDSVAFERANLWGGGSQTKKAVWKRIEEEKDMPNSLLYSVRPPSPAAYRVVSRMLTAAQVLLCASMCGMADLCSECEYLLCLRISATAFNDKGLPVDDTDATFEKKFGTIPKGF
jgi:hypothetical protein